MNVFLDLWGVLTDSRRMTPAYREGLAAVLSARFGASADLWERAHDAASAWFTDYMDRPETWTHGTWLEVVDRAEAESLVRTFRDVGIAPPSEPLSTARALEFEVMSRIDAAFPDARPAVMRLKRAGHRVFVSTNATESNARGSLTGARLLDAFEGVFTGERLNAGKGTSEYWAGILDRLDADPSRALVVDDRLEYLRAAASCGFAPVLVDRQGQHDSATIPPNVRAILRNLAALPHYARVLDSVGSG